MGRGKPLGLPKSGGRAKGVPNKKTLYFLSVQETCELKGFSPIDVLIELCTHPDPSIKIQAAKEVCQYIYPKKKALEVSASLDGNLDVKSSFENQALDELRELFKNGTKERKSLG